MQEQDRVQETRPHPKNHQKSLKLPILHHSLSFALENSRFPFFSAETMFVFICYHPLGLPLASASCHVSLA